MDTLKQWYVDTRSSTSTTPVARAFCAAINGNQVIGPYGNFRDIQGSINTAKGFTGQYKDSLTGLDYYGSWYYGQVAEVFL